MASRSAVCVDSHLILSTRSRGLFGSKSRPVSPSRMSAAMAPSREAMTGTPQASASRIIRGKFSYQREAKTRSSPLQPPDHIHVLHLTEPIDSWNALRLALERGERRTATGDFSGGASAPRIFHASMTVSTPFSEESRPAKSAYPPNGRRTRICGQEVRLDHQAFGGKAAADILVANEIVQGDKGVHLRPGADHAMHRKRRRHDRAGEVAVAK